MTVASTLSATFTVKNTSVKSFKVQAPVSYHKHSAEATVCLCGQFDLIYDKKYIFYLPKRDNLLMSP